MLRSTEATDTRVKVEPSILETGRLILNTKQMLLRVDALLVKLHDEVDAPEAPPLTTR